MEKDLIKFNDNVTLGNKEISKYEDEKGNVLIIPTAQLICNCSYMELDEKEYKIALFNKQIDKLEYETTTITRPFNKYDRTKKEEDMFTLEEQEVEVKKVWVVGNGLKVLKSYTTKDEALKYVEKTNNQIFNTLEITSR